MTSNVVTTAISAVAELLSRICRATGSLRKGLSVGRLFRLMESRVCLLQVFHCVHFECPVNPASLAASEQEQKKSASAASDESQPASSVQPMDVAAAQPADNAAAAVQQQQPYMRLQGLRRSNSHEDASGVDHGDGYGIGLLGRSHTPPSDAV